MVLFSNCCKSTYIYHKKLFTWKVNVAPEKKIWEAWIQLHQSLLKLIGTFAKPQWWRMKYVLDVVNINQPWKHNLLPRYKCFLKQCIKKWFSMKHMFWMFRINPKHRRGLIGLSMQGLIHQQDLTPPRWQHSDANQDFAISQARGNSFSYS